MFNKNIIINFTDNYDGILYRAALLHNIGKIEVKKVIIQSRLICKAYIESFDKYTKNCYYIFYYFKLYKNIIIMTWQD